MLFDPQRATEKAVGFHGHLCPGLVLGVRAVELALQMLGAGARDDELVAIVETDM